MAVWEQAACPVACLAEDGGQQQHAQAPREALPHAREAPLLQHRQHHRSAADGREDAAPLRELGSARTKSPHPEVCML